MFLCCCCCRLLRASNMVLNIRVALCSGCGGLYIYRVPLSALFCSLAFFLGFCNLELGTPLHISRGLPRLQYTFYGRIYFTVRTFVPGEVKRSAIRKTIQLEVISRWAFFRRRRRLTTNALHGSVNCSTIKKKAGSTRTKSLFNESCGLQRPGFVFASIT